MKKITSISLLLGILLSADLILAVPFDWAPEDHAKYWAGEAPYQRDIYWDFATNPFGGPTPTGAPGAQYGGTDDPFLWESDFVGSIDRIWYQTLPGISATGLIGLDNRSGTTVVDDVVWFNIDNWDSPGRKSIWMELDWSSNDNRFFKFEVYGADSFGTTVDTKLISVSDPRDIGNGFYRTNIEWYQNPNPEWEQFLFTFVSLDGDYILIDQLHIATQCVVPEPCSLLLFGSGIPGLAGFNKKSKR